MKTKAVLLAFALGLPCAAQQYTEEYEAWAARNRPETSVPMSALDFAQHMIELQKLAKGGETAWDYFERNRITGPPIENSIEVEPKAE